MFAQPSAVKSVTDELARQSNTIAVGRFNTEVKTLQLCSFALAKGVAYEVKTRVLDIVPFKNLEHTKLTKSAANSAVEYDEKRRFLSLAKTYGRPAPKSGDEKLLETAMKDLLANCVHMKYLLQTLDLYAQLTNPNSKRTSTSVFLSTAPDPQMFHRDKTANSDRNPWSQDTRGHCFSVVIALGEGEQAINYIRDNQPRQLRLAPGVAVLLGPAALHAGSSTTGLRLHCAYSVGELDDYDSSSNDFEHDDSWGDWRSDAGLVHVPWYEEALKLSSIFQR